MPKCLNPTCLKQVTGAAYCDDHKYVPDQTTNLRKDQDERLDNVTGRGLQVNNEPARDRRDRGKKSEWTS